MAMIDASVKPFDPIMEMYAYDIGKMSADPQGAAEIVPSGRDWSGAGIPPVVTYNIHTKPYLGQLSFFLKIFEYGKLYVQLDVRVGTELGASSRR